MRRANERRAPASMTTNLLANVWWRAGLRKRRTTKCSRPAAKIFRRKADDVSGSAAIDSGQIVREGSATGENGSGVSPKNPRTGAPGAELLTRYRKVRDFTHELCGSLKPEDCVVQSMPDVSPTKWHLAHTSWFFETFLLKPWMPSYQSEVPEYAFLFNSYYNAAGDMHRRDLRGLLSRPTVDETYRYP